MMTNFPSQNLHLNLALLFHLSNQFKDQLIGRYFADAGVTAAQFKVLINVYKGVVTPAVICKHLLMDTGAMSRMIARMVDSDLLLRRPDPQDKRQVQLALTDKAKRICQNFEREALDTIITDLTARLTPDEVDSLMALLLKMLPDELTARHLEYAEALSDDR